MRMNMDMRRNMANMEEVTVMENGVEKKIMVPKAKETKEGPCRDCKKLTRSHKADDGRFQCHVCFKHQKEQEEFREGAK